MPLISLRDRYRGCLLGLAAGDAVGSTLEFSVRDSVPELDDMVGGGPFSLEAGQWTDDTSMALCLATSLVEKGAFDPQDQMNRYCDWADFGYLSSNGKCFDIGNTVSAALDAYRRSGDPFSGSADPRSAGNGSIRRLAPVVLYFFPNRESAVHYARESSRTTHGAAEAIDACGLTAELLIRGLAGASLEDFLAPLAHTFSTPALESIAGMKFLGKERSEIRGSGYVVESLEAALWCIAQTGTFREAVLLAANLGEHEDTTAALCGQLAGTVYGLEAIPESWRERLAMSDDILYLADRLHDAHL